MKVYYGSGERDYLEMHMKKEEIQTLITTKYQNLANSIAASMKSENCDN